MLPTPSQLSREQGRKAVDVGSYPRTSVSYPPETRAVGTTPGSKYRQGCPSFVCSNLHFARMKVLNLNTDSGALREYECNYKNIVIKTFFSINVII